MKNPLLLPHPNPLFFWESRIVGYKGSGSEKQWLQN
jgi:hypothetical protein